MSSDYDWNECSKLTNNDINPIDDKDTQLLNVIGFYNIYYLVLVMYAICVSISLIYIIKFVKSEIVTTVTTT